MQGRDGEEIWLFDGAMRMNDTKEAEDQQGIRQERIDTVAAEDLRGARDDGRSYATLGAKKPKSATFFDTGISKAPD